ncbi:MAG: potassium channel family protein [Candidatus Micrarchaeia archaeon]
MGFVSNHKVTTAVLLVLINIIIGTIAMHYLEGWDIVDSVYFSVVTLATIGYGDLFPKTSNGKIFVVIYIILGVSTTLYALSLLADNYFERYSRNYESLAQTVIKKPVTTIRKIGAIPIKNVSKLHKLMSGPNRYRFRFSKK